MPGDRAANGPAPRSCISWMGPEAGNRRPPMTEPTTRAVFDASTSEEKFEPWPTEADLYHCYRLLLGRNPDEDGWRAYREGLSTTPLASLVEMFLCSEEFRSQPAYQALLGRDDQVELELVELNGHSMWVDPTDLLAAPLLGGAGWEPEVSAVMERVLQPGWTVIDIGANVGYFTLLAAAGREHRACHRL